MADPLAPHHCAHGSPSSRGSITLSIADLKEATAVIVEQHYLHRGRTMAQLPYWIERHGDRIGVLLFAYPRLSRPFHGYEPFQLVELARLWIDPRAQTGRVVDAGGCAHAPSVASCAVAKALRRLREDWHSRYPSLPTPTAVVSWADLTRHEGTVYRAANFLEVGVSGGTGHKSGRRRNGGSYKDHPDYANCKRAFVYELREDSAEYHATAA